jgi:hypothetical protein
MRSVWANAETESAYKALMDQPEGTYIPRSPRPGESLAEFADRLRWVTTALIKVAPALDNSELCQWLSRCTAWNKVDWGEVAEALDRPTLGRKRKAA